MDRVTFFKKLNLSGRFSALVYNRIFNYTVLIVLGLGIGVASLLLGASVYGVPMFLAYFTSPSVLILNLIPTVLLILFAYFVTGRPWLAFLFSALPVLILSIVGYFKMQIRAVPFTASDLAFFNEARAVISGYRLTVNWKLFAVTAAFVLGLIVSVLLLKRKFNDLRTRLFGSVITLALSVILFAAVYTNADVYDLVKSAFDIKPWASTEYFISKGFVYPFIHSIKYAANKTPAGFNRSEAQRILASYTNTDIPVDKKINFVTIMLEAYSDLSRFDVLDFAIDVYEPLNRLRAESVYGELVVNTFGGGTIDTERLFLTGYTALSNYTVPTNSYLRYLSGQGYYLDGVHAGDSWFYDRNVIHEYLGFDNYYFLEDYKYGNRQDSFFFPAVRALYDARDPDMPYFSYSLSYQNHGAYDSEVTWEPYYINQGEMSDESFNIVNNYLTGIYDTTQWIERIIETFREETEPVVVVIFGDHMPWLGNYESVYKELGINIDVGTDEGFYNYYTTPYLIWANTAAEEAAGTELRGYGGSYSACFLMGEVFRLCGIEGEAYMQALRELMEYTDVLNTPTGLHRTDGILIHIPDETLTNALNDFKKLEYYRLHNLFTE